MGKERGSTREKERDRSKRKSMRDGKTGKEARERKKEPGEKGRV